MKKKKSLLLSILSLVSAFSLAFAFGCNNGINDDEVLKGNYEGVEDVVEDPADTWVLQSIKLDVSALTTVYQYGQDFDQTKKPAVTATFATLESVVAVEENKLSGTAVELVTEDRTVSANDIKVDFGQYDKMAVGTYNIYVSYSHAGITRSASYEVKVESTDPAIGGITAYTDGFVDTYTMETADGVNISLDGLYFLNVNAEMEVDYDNPIPKATDENPDGYTLKFFKNGTVIESLEGVKEKGTYTIMATYNNASAFVTVNVLDPIVSFGLKDGVESAKFSQVQSPVDELTETWVFAVTYTSGKVTELKKGDAGLIIGNLVTVTADARNTTVTYTEDGETKSVSVSYTITKDDKLTNEENAFDRTALGITSEKDVAQENLTGANAFLALAKGDKAVVKYRPGTDSGTLEIRYDALKINFNGFGTLTVSARSTGSNNVSSLALKSADGKYITALYDAADTKIGKSVTSDGEIYTVSGDMQKRPAPTPDDPNKTENIPYMARILTFVIPEAGEYTLCTVDSVTVDGVAVATNRNTRVYKIEQVDVFDATIDRTSYSFEINSDNVKKDYVAGQTAADLSKEGLTAVFKEIHSVDTDKNVEKNLTAADLSIALTAGDLTKLNTKGTVTVTYTSEGGITRTATYEINIKSPVAGVNSVAISTEKSTINLESATATVDLNKDDIILHANTASGSVITLGDGESVVYELYKGEEKLEAWTGLGAGVYTVKAVVVLNNNEKLGGDTVIVSGTTEFIPADLTITVKEYVAPSESSSYESFFISNVEGTFTATPYAANAEIEDNSLFTLKAGIALTTSQGKDNTQIQNNGGSNKVEFTDSKGTTHNPNVGIAQTVNGAAETWFTVTAKENIKLIIYVTYANLSYNSNKAGTISYKVNGADGESKELSTRKTVWAVTVTLNKDDVVTFATAGTDGMGWLFGAEAEKAASQVSEESFFIPNVEGTFTATSYAANAEIEDNSLFMLKAGIALTTSQGKDNTQIQNNGGSNKVEFTDSKGTTHNPNVGIAQTVNGAAETWFTVTAKENIKLIIYVTYANLSYNSNKAGTISYKVNGADGESKELSTRKTVWAVTVTLNKDDVVTFATAGTDGMGWLFGVEAENA